MRNVKLKIDITDDNRYVIRAKRLLFWKVVYVPIGEFDKKPMVFDDYMQVIAACYEIKKNGLKNYILNF